MDITMSTTAGAKDVYVKTFVVNVMECWFGCLSATKETIQTDCSHHVMFLIQGLDPKENDGDEVSRLKSRWRSVHIQLTRCPKMCFIWFIGWILCYNISPQLQYTGGRCCWPLVSPAQTIRITLTPHRSAEAKTRNNLMLQKPTRKMHPPSWLKTPDPNVPCWTPINFASFLDVWKGKSACT